jgi:hypothetical protein
MTAWLAHQLRQRRLALRAPERAFGAALYAHCEAHAIRMLMKVKQG